jgi:hypothetical protein
MHCTCLFLFLAAIFSPQLSNSQRGSGGIWTGAGTTNTRTSSTLFVTNLDPRVELSQVEALFSGEPGFFAFRTVRRMCFVDFTGVPQANAAMRKYQNHLFYGLIAHDPQTKLLKIDYDKDDREKRDQQFQNQVTRVVNSEENAEVVELQCDACGHFSLRLRIPAPKTLASLPTRPLDRSVILETAKYLTEMSLAKGEEKAIRRAGGVEKQYRLVCKSCALPLAYSSTPFDTKIKHLFLLDAALRATKTLIRQGKRMKGEEKFVLRGAAAQPAASGAKKPPPAGSSTAADAASSTASPEDAIADVDAAAVSSHDDDAPVLPSSVSATDSAPPPASNTDAVAPMQLEPSVAESLSTATSTDAAGAPPAATTPAASAAAAASVQSEADAENL